METPMVVKKDMRKKKEIGVYMVNLLTRKIHLNFNNVGKNLKESLEKKIRKEIEGKCSIEGFIKPNSTKIVSYSSGILVEKELNSCVLS